MAPRRYSLGKRAQAVEDTRRRIVDATFDLHNEKGVLNTSMQDVAERADVALRTVYHHFPTVNDLVNGCAGHVITLLAPPTPAIFAGLTTLDARLRRLVRELFAMYERAALQLEAARCQQNEVPALANFVRNEAAMREALVREALRPFAANPRTIQEATALTDFYVWKAFNQRDVSTHRAAAIVSGALVALISPALGGKKGRTQ